MSHCLRADCHLEIPHTHKPSPPAERPGAGERCQCGKKAIGEDFWHTVDGCVNRQIGPPAPPAVSEAGPQEPTQAEARGEGPTTAIFQDVAARDAIAASPPLSEPEGAVSELQEEYEPTELCDVPACAAYRLELEDRIAELEGRTKPALRSEAPKGEAGPEGETPAPVGEPGYFGHCPECEGGGTPDSEDSGICGECGATLTFDDEQENAAPAPSQSPQEADWKQMAIKLADDLRLYHSRADVLGLFDAMMIEDQRGIPHGTTTVAVNDAPPAVSEAGPGAESSQRSTNQGGSDGDDDRATDEGAGRGSGSGRGTESADRHEGRGGPREREADAGQGAGAHGGGDPLRRAVASAPAQPQGEAGPGAGHCEQCGFKLPHGFACPGRKLEPAPSQSQGEGPTTAIFQDVAARDAIASPPPLSGEFCSGSGKQGVLDERYLMCCSVCGFKHPGLAEAPQHRNIKCTGPFSDGGDCPVHPRFPSPPPEPRGPQFTEAQVKALVAMIAERAEPKP